MPSLEDIRNRLSNHRPRLIPVDDAFRAAVAVILHERSDDLRMLFIERTRRDGDPWSGHLAFPGGRMDTGDTVPQETAERETYEEIGLDLLSADYLGRLNDLSAHIHPIKVSGFVYSIDHPGDFIPSAEVSDVFWIPFFDLIDSTRRVTYRYRERGIEHRVPAIDLLGPDRPVLWGLTYRFVTQLTDLIGYELPRHEPGY